MEGEVDIAKELEKDIVVQANDVQLNSWARTLLKKPDGHFYVEVSKTNSLASKCQDMDSC